MKIEEVKKLHVPLYIELSADEGVALYTDIREALEALDITSPSKRDKLAIPTLYRLYDGLYQQNCAP